MTASRPLLPAPPPPPVVCPTVCLCSPVWIHGGVGAVCQGPLAQGRRRDVAFIGGARPGALSGSRLLCRKNGLLGESVWSGFHSPPVRLLKLFSFLWNHRVETNFQDLDSVLIELLISSVKNTKDPVLNLVWFLQTISTAGVLHEAQVQSCDRAQRLPRRPTRRHSPQHVHPASQRPGSNLWTQNVCFVLFFSPPVQTLVHCFISGINRSVSLSCGNIGYLSWIHGLVCCLFWEPGGRGHHSGAKHRPKRSVKHGNTHVTVKTLSIYVFFSRKSVMFWAKKINNAH